jgi:hypothetical protein
VIYADEVCPGNRLSLDAKRMIQGVYCSFLNFGPSALCKEDFWLTPCAIRSQRVRKIRGGMSGLIAALLQVLFSHDKLHIQKQVCQSSCQTASIFGSTRS